jgi:hypothetical protein
MDEFWTRSRTLELLFLHAALLQVCTAERNGRYTRQQQLNPA